MCNVKCLCVCQLEEGEALDRVLLYCQAATGRLMLELRKLTSQDLYVKAGGFQKSWFTSPLGGFVSLTHRVHSDVGRRRLPVVMTHCACDAFVLQ